MLLEVLPKICFMFAQMSQAIRVEIKRFSFFSHLNTTNTHNLLYRSSLPIQYTESTIVYGSFSKSRITWYIPVCNPSFVIDISVLSMKAEYKDLLTVTKMNRLTRTFSAALEGNKFARTASKTLK